MSHIIWRRFRDNYASIFCNDYIDNWRYRNRRYKRSCVRINFTKVFRYLYFSKNNTFSNFTFIHEYNFLIIKYKNSESNFVYKTQYILYIHSIGLYNWWNERTYDFSTWQYQLLLLRPSPPPTPSHPANCPEGHKSWK